jgi:murein DD-endopeptidase MepM/ murein hydrolase activator NlpD
MSHDGSRISRAHAQGAQRQQAQIPSGAVTFVWRARSGLRTSSLSYLACAGFGGVTIALGIWGAAVTSYLVFKDDILGGLMNRQAAVQYAYEDRIRTLRTQLDQMTSRQLVDQSAVERRVDDIARRQAVLETRQAIVAALNETAPAARDRAPAMPVPLPSPLARGPEERVVPVGDTLRLAPPPERQSRLESRDQTVQTATAEPAAAAENTAQAATLARVEVSLARVETAQQAELQNLETRTERRARRIRGVLADLGLDHLKPAQRSGRTAARAGIGGPFVPLPEPRADASAFERQVYRIQTVLREHDELNRVATTIPLGRPHAGELEQSSGFGPRLDPFLRSWAMHSGVDFRAATGEAARATAPGRVTHAGYSGGYGLMVEVDHGNGLATRYAHLSRIDVAVGDTVEAEQRLGRVGSTGRSTGPHLHYETRINGEAVDPLKFLRAGLRLASVE